jgi:hypothetical protein
MATRVPSYQICQKLAPLEPRRVVRILRCMAEGTGEGVETVTGTPASRVLGSTEFGSRRPTMRAFRNGFEKPSERPPMAHR